MRVLGRREIKTVRKHMPDLGVNGRRVGARYGRVRDDVGSAFALRGASITCLFIVATEKVPGTGDRLLWLRGEYYPT